MDNQEILNSESQVLPFSLEAEQAVLGAILIDPEIISDVAEIIKPEHFYLPQHQAIAEVMWAMDALSKKIDSITVLEELKREKVFDDVGGKLSFVLAFLDDNDTGFVLNAVHSKENCFLYVKEIVKGESYIMLSNEEVEALRIAKRYGTDDIIE